MKKLPILPIAQFPADETADFYANDFIRHIAFHHKAIDKPHKHDFYLTLLFLRGKGRHEVDFNAYEIKKGSVFMLNPGQSHHWEFSEDTDGYVFFHTRAFYDVIFSHKSIHDFPFFYSLQDRPCLYLDDNQLKHVVPLFKAILKEYNDDKPLKFQKIGSLLDLVYIDLTRIYITARLQKTSRTSNSYMEKLRVLNRLIDMHFLTEKSPGGYADRMHVPVKHLNRITKEVLGKTTSDLIAERVILEAKRMLAHADTTISEVAGHLGYTDHSYFSRFFKKECGISPTAFGARYR